MTVNYFHQRNSQGLGVRIGLKVTDWLARQLPLLSARIAYPLFMKPPRLKARTTPKQADRSESISSTAGRFILNYYGSGRRVAVISHGWGDSSASFGAMIESLNEKGYLVVAVDHVGHGATSGKYSHLPAFIEALALTLDELEKQNLDVELMIGHSMGALSVLNLPVHRLAQKRLILMSLPVRFFDIMFAKVEQLGLSRELLMRTLDWVSKPYGLEWSDLQPYEHRYKLNEQTTLISDRDDTFAPISDIEQFVADSSAKLVCTDGLGHRRIVADPDVLAVL